MNIKELFNKLFKGSGKSYWLALPTDLVAVPMRDQLSDDKIKGLEEYKDKYLEVLGKKKYFTSHDIASANFNNEMLMNFELFGRLVANRDTTYNLDTMAEYEKRELWIKQRVTPLKIKLYLEKMEAMFNETHLKIVALKEIYSECGKKLSKDKKNAILNEIYNLTSSYIIFKNNINAALTEVESYKTEMHDIEVFDISLEDYILGEEDIYITKYASSLIPNKVLELAQNKSLTILERLAYIERELEIYAYNQLKIDDLNQELDEIDKIEKVPANGQMLLDRINELEIKYLVLNYYGGHELNLKPLYEVKFDILTIDIVRQEESPFKGISAGMELKHYKDIVLDRLETNITGVDSLLSQRLDDDHKYLIKHFMGLIKLGDHYNSFTILNDTFMLALILSTTSDEKMINFFHNYQIDFKNSRTIYRFTRELPNIGIEIENKVPLSTVCWINNIDILNRKTHNGIILADTNNIVQIYNYFASIEKEHSRIYKIPDGITEIQWPHKYNSMIIDEVFKDINCRTLITPNSLKKICIPRSICKLDAHKAILTEGLESIPEIGLISYGTHSITIPSTLQNAYKSVLANALHNDDAYLDENDTYTQKLIFTNCEKSITLHDQEQMNEIINCLYEISLLYLWNKLESCDLDHLKNFKPDLVPRDIVLVSNDGHQTVVSVSTIVSIEFLNKLKKYFLTYKSEVSLSEMLYYFGHADKEVIINKIKKTINDTINNVESATNKRK